MVSQIPGIHGVIEKHFPVGSDPGDPEIGDLEGVKVIKTAVLDGILKHLDLGTQAVLLRLLEVGVDDQKRRGQREDHDENRCQQY